MGNSDDSSKRVLDNRNPSPEGFTTRRGFWDEPRDAHDESLEGFMNEPGTAQHACAPGKTGAQLRGSYTCGIQRRTFEYDGSWHVNNGVIHWTVTIRCLSSSWKARGTLFGDHRAGTTEAVRQSIEQWIEAFSSGQASSR